VKQNKVEPVRLIHDVKFASGNQLPANEAAQLDAFIDRLDVGYGDRVYVLTESGGTAPSRQRTDAVLRQLARQGVQASSLPSPEAQPGIVRIVINRHVVVPQHCPDWSKPATSDYSNTAMSNLGCANASNLGLMVADPSELIQGREPGAADGTASALAIQRYRTDKIKALDKSGTETGGK
jgi:pilus assembly protein CpaD